MKHTIALRLASVQLILGSVLTFAGYVIASDHIAVSCAIGSLISVSCTAPLAFFASKKVSRGSEPFFVKAFGRIQLLRMFAAALLLALAIVYLAVNPVFTVAGFLIVQLLGVYIVFVLIRKEKYLWT